MERNNQSICCQAGGLMTRSIYISPESMDRPESQQKTPAEQRTPAKNTV